MKRPPRDHEPLVTEDHVVIITRHNQLIDLLIERKVLQQTFSADDNRPVNNWSRHIHIRTDQIRNRDIILDGSRTLPVWQLALTRSVSVIPLDLTWEDQNRRWLSLERLREIAGAPLRYRVEAILSDDSTPSAGPVS